MAHTPAFRLSISPVKAGAEVGSYQKVTVSDGGSKPLTITMSAHEIVRDQTGTCHASRTPAGWATVSPSHFVLKPLTREVVTLHVLPGAKAGEHVLAAYATTVAGTHGNIKVITSIASQWVVHVPGTAAATAQPCITLAPVAHAAASGGGGLPVMAIGGGSVIVALAAVCAVLVHKVRHPKVITYHDVT